MRAFAVDGFGEAGSVRELPEPEPGDGEVRVRVAAASVNPVDAAAVQGYLKDYAEHRFPLIPGIDASGEVEAVGAGVGRWTPGDAVFGAAGKMIVGEGTYAEVTTMSAAAVIARPASLDDVAAAALPLAGVSALQMLEAIEPGEGETVLVVGASGGVGSFLVPLAAGRGARVIAVARAENHAYVRERGASETIDYTQADVAEALSALSPGGIDAIADLVGDRQQVALLAERLREGGRAASLVGAVDPEALRSKGFTAVNVQTVVTAERLEALLRGLEAGTFAAPWIATFPLERAGEALAKVGERHVRGKVVLALA